MNQMTDNPTSVAVAEAPVSAGEAEAFWEKLAAEYGTPFYAYDAVEAQSQVRHLQSLFPSEANPRLMYSFKANPLPSLAREIREAGCEADLTSPGEIEAARLAGFDFTKALYGGPGKSELELIEALEAGVRQFSIESEPDLRRLASAADRLEQEVRVLLRINPMTAPQAKLAMSGVPSQFGFEEDVLRSEGASLLKGVSSRVRVVGIHIYWGTQIGDAEALLSCFESAVTIAEELSEIVGFPLEVLNLGGGFPWPYSHSGRGDDLLALKEGLKSLFLSSKAAQQAEWWFESGRFAVGSSGTLVTRVMDLKLSKDDRQFLILDTGIHHLGGMAGLGRIPRFSIDLEVPNERLGNDEIQVDVVGQLCTPLDCIGRRIKIPRIEIGDLLRIPNVGAYGLTGSVIGFLSRRAPAEVVYKNHEVVSVSHIRQGHVEAS
ncbi:MAG: type III PLP-dependent enzyme [Verrucomicrobiota bacterium]